MELAEERKVSTRMTQTLVPAQPDMRYGLNKVYLGGEVCKWLSVLKGRLQMEEGQICRLALCTSLAEPYLPDLTLIDQDRGKEFLVPALMGPLHVSLITFALLRQRMYKDGLDPDDQAQFEAQFQAHLSRGMLTLGVRVKNLADIGRLVGEAQERFKSKRPIKYGALATADLTETEPLLQDAYAQEGQEAGIDTIEGLATQRREPVEIPVKQEAQSLMVSLPQPVPAIEQAPQDFGVDSLWGALLPPPVEVKGQKNSLTSRKWRKRL